MRQARADLNGVAANLQQAFRKTIRPRLISMATSSLEEDLTHNARPTMLVLLGAAVSCCSSRAPMLRI